MSTVMWTSDVYPDTSTLDRWRYLQTSIEGYSMDVHYSYYEVTPHSTSSAMALQVAVLGAHSVATATVCCHCISGCRYSGTLLSASWLGMMAVAFLGTCCHEADVSSPMASHPAATAIIPSNADSMLAVASQLTAARQHTRVQASTAPYGDGQCLALLGPVCSTVASHCTCWQAWWWATQGGSLLPPC